MSRLIKYITILVILPTLLSGCLAVAAGGVAGYELGKHVDVSTH
ncbi:MAG TPA: hypothetical protein VND43_03245 [Burkholderiales bacterium]|nr:hypothetical protein [Burkholderiales bacterium]